MANRRLNFDDNVKKCWIVKRDENYDEFIALNGKNSLGKGIGLDHIYLISSVEVGLWITGKHVQKKIDTIRKKVPLLTIKQLGDGEAIVSVLINDLDSLCKAARAKKRKQLSEDQRQRLRDISPFLKNKKAS